MAVRDKSPTYRKRNEEIMETVDGKALPTRHRIEIKVSEEQKDVIVRGAEIARQGISEFVRAAADRAARELIAQRKKNG